jgi:hypothetical protein
MHAAPKTWPRAIQDVPEAPKTCEAPKPAEGPQDDPTDPHDGPTDPHDGPKDPQRLLYFCF